jgi:putative nucleotidyltransferase with HDIG domain
VLLFSLPVILGLTVAQAAQALIDDPMLLRLCLPATMIALLATLTVDPRAGFMLVAVTASLHGLVAQQGADYLLLALVAGFTTIYTSRQLRKRGDLIQVAWKVAAVNIVTLFTFSCVTGSLLPDPYQILAAALNPFLSVAATLYLVRVFERLFGVVTDLRLLELTGLRHPLMTQLEEKAPGSYQHVLNVTKLAEAAANAIGANYLLARAGALFHDVGKMVKPKYFSENQVTLDDKKAHSRLSPYMSVLIIKNHVKEGVELARRAGLPQAIIDFIPQHHGTGLIRYFYGAALRRYEESPTAGPVREADFRYPGPRPQSIEAAIVLLADSVEAIAASKFTGGQVSVDEIRRVCMEAITERFEDTQFDECDLTFKHLHEIREAFVRTLAARYHVRIAYPAVPRPAGQQTRAGRTGEATSAGITLAGAGRIEPAG